jgi:signal transduction histidine kinase
MTSDLLDLAAARVGERIPMNAAPMDLGLLADELADEVALSYPGRTLDVHRDGDLRGHWDRDRLAQLLSNLLTNAFKYGAAGPVRVELHDAGDDVILAIRNSGPPIPADALPHLFEPLRWRDEERAGRDHGSYRSVGLGLFIVREIAKAHGGTVTVESATNDGTTFTVRLPRHARPDASATN